MSDEFPVRPPVVPRRFAVNCPQAIDLETEFALGKSDSEVDSRRLHLDSVAAAHGGFRSDMGKSHSATDSAPATVDSTRAN